MTTTTLSPSEVECLEGLLSTYSSGTRLTRAELKELRHIARAEVAKDSAAQAGISHETVRKYRKRLYRQLGVSGATDILVGLLGLSLRQLAPRDAAEAGQRIAG